MDNLAMTAIAARKLGLSYGKYMALHGDKVITPKYIESIGVVPDGYCAVCGDPLYNKDRRKRKYCGDDCRVIGCRKHSNERRPKAQKIPDVRTCDRCGKRFNLGDPGTRYKYCSAECYRNANRARNREAAARNREARIAKKQKGDSLM